MHTRVEPKTFFANERTFLQWLQIRWAPLVGGDGWRVAMGCRRLMQQCHKLSCPAMPSVLIHLHAQRLSGAAVCSLTLFFLVLLQRAHPDDIRLQAGRRLCYLLV